MVSISKLYEDLMDLINQKFYSKTESDGKYLTSHQDISGKLNISQTSYKGKNVVVDNTSGDITFEDKPTIPSDVSDLSDSSNTAFTPKSHSHGNITDDGLLKVSNSIKANKVVVTNGDGKITYTESSIPSASSSTPSADTTDGSYGSGSDYARANHSHPKSTLYADASHSHSASDLPSTMPPSSHNQATSTITNSNAYNNIKAGESTTLTLTDQEAINSAINTKLGEIVGLKFIEITTSQPTPSASTMNKLYVVSENSKVNVYYTKATTSGNNTTYSLVKLDEDILDELSISYDDITDKPLSFTPSSHNHTYDDIDTTEVSGNIDYNDYKTKGQYIIWYSDQQNNTNKPTTRGGLLVVETIPNGIAQFFYCYGTTNNQIYYRTYYSPTPAWNDWIRIDAQDKSSSTHTHGSLANNGTLNSDITSVNKVAVTDSNNNLKTISNLPDTSISFNNNKALANSVSPIDLAMYNEFNANRLAYIPGANITVEYSTDGGSTYTQMNVSEANKSKICTDYYSVVSGNNDKTNIPNNRLRITIFAGGEYNVKGSDVYISAKKLLVYLSCSTGSKVTVEKGGYVSPINWTEIGTYTIGGMSGWNSIPFNMGFGGYANQLNSGSKIGYIRLTFFTTNTSNNVGVSKIRLFGETAWTTPSTLATTGKMYTYDMNKNVTFPAKIIKSGGTSSQFLKADGSTDSNTYLKTSDVIIDITTGFNTYVASEYTITNLSTVGYTNNLENSTNDSSITEAIIGYLNEEYTGELYVGLQFKIYSSYSDDYIIGIVSAYDTTSNPVDFMVSVTYNSEVIKYMIEDMSQ